jgi:hypothetical protein
VHATREMNRETRIELGRLSLTHPNASFSEGFPGRRNFSILGHALGVKLIFSYLCSV